MQASFVGCKVSISRLGLKAPRVLAKTRDMGMGCENAQGSRMLGQCSSGRRCNKDLNQ